MGFQRLMSFPAASGVSTNASFSVVDTEAFQYHCGHLNEAEWAYPEPPNFITILAEETVQFLVDSHQLCH